MSSPVRRKYKKNFLNQVIARMDFASSISITPSGLSEKVINILKKHYPIPEHHTHRSQAVLVTPKGLKEGVEETNEWLFFSKNRENHVKITDDFILLDIQKYISYEILCDHFIPVVDALFDSIDNLQIKRLGLRYIDSIELKESNPTKWDKYLNKKLLSSFDLAEKPEIISRVFQVIEYKYDEMYLRFQYGMPNPDYPARIKRKLFVLDHDAFCTLLLGCDEIKGWLDRFHGVINNSFESVITDGLRQKMGIKNG